MRTDPRAACANAEERFIWAFVHDAICHPLMAITNWSRLSVRFHDWTSWRAWPRVVPAAADPVMPLPSRHHGPLEVRSLGPGIYAVRHPAINHTLHTYAKDGIEAVEIAERWFDSLAEVGIHPDGLR
ncbi:hypothetical protein [Variovorax sp. JS1663]|uniref:hypothetical protein n=1 Tax=Variovorax sp. JS1663 TaxID=1851577 RepID=UPI000B34141F|nr:hypothetical protein [Variovorax sp. JS1663]OUM01787.1 hypothetical protein A8M77_14595 [Variovorax sp. JS1663]